MVRVQKDVGVRLREVTAAWERLRPNKVFFDFTLESFKEAAQPYREACEEIARCELALAHAVAKRDLAAGPLSKLVQGVVDGVKGDRSEGPDGELYAAMGYVPRSQRATGLVRARKQTPGDGAAE